MSVCSKHLLYCIYIYARNIIDVIKKRTMAQSLNICKLFLYITRVHTLLLFISVLIFSYILHLRLPSNPFFLTCFYPCFFAYFSLPFPSMHISRGSSLNNISSGVIFSVFLLFNCHQITSYYFLQHQDFKRYAAKMT
jgi:hypothetical protein